MRWHNDHALACALLVLGGCALSEGNPWGIAEASLEARFAPPPARLTGEGRLLTSSSYAVELELLELGFDGLTLTVTADEAATTFDPANPPPGYSLCHGGHCHAEDGRLVDYEEIEAELGGAIGGASRLAMLVEADVELGETAVPLPISGCDGPCYLERGVLSRVAVTLHELTVSGRVYEARGGQPPRLPAEGLAFHGTISLELDVSAPASAAIDDGRRLGVRVASRFELAASLFDGVAWPELPSGDDGAADASAAATAIRERIATDSRLTSSVSRFDP